MPGMQALLLTIFLAQGVSDDAILIGMDGPAQSFSADEENLGMRLVIKHVNATGGVHGRHLVERSYPRGTANSVETQLASARVRRPTRASVRGVWCAKAPPPGGENLGA